MAAPGSSSLLALLRDKEFISRDQWQELSRISPPLDNAALLRDLVRRTWLTPFQANRIAGGNAKDLILGPYRVFEPIGEGGMGQVFKARHVQMDRMVGLKVIPKEYLANANAVSRFYREVRAVAKLSHPNVVTAHDAGQEGDTHYFAMEFVEGIDLARLVKQSGPLPIAQACDFIRQAALGLQHANEKGLVHRDIKPGNIIVSGGNGTPVAKVLDFGLARFEDQSGQTKLTKVDSVLGTVDYISPEQAGDAREVDTRADIFSLGCALFYVLTGKPPFQGATAMDRMVARRVRDADSVRAARPELPAALERVLAKMLARNRADRYQSPAEVAVALEPFTRIDANGSLKRQKEPSSASISTTGPQAAMATNQARTASSSAVLPPVVNKPLQRETKVAPSSEFETMTEGVGIIVGKPKIAAKGKQGAWSKRVVGVAVAILVGAVALWAGGVFPNSTGNGGRDSAPAKLDPPGPIVDVPPISAPPKPLRIAVTPTFVEKDGSKWDDTAELLDSLGEGYKYISYPLHELSEPGKLSQVDVLFLTDAPGGNDPAIAPDLRNWVRNGGTLYAAGWRYESVALAFPEYQAKSLAGEGAHQQVRGTVLDAGLREFIGPEILLKFGLSRWKAAAFGGDNVNVLLQGRYVKDRNAGNAVAPLLVKFRSGEGTVIFNSFAEGRPRRTESGRKLLQYLVFSAVTAKAQTEVTQAMLKSGFSLRKSTVSTVSNEAPSVRKTFRNEKVDDLRFVLGFENRGAKLRFTVVSPSGERFEQVGVSTISMDFKDAAPGDWEYTATADIVPFPSFPLTLTVGGTAPLKPAPPALEKADIAGANGFVALFNGKDTSGWDPLNSHRTEWVVHEGALVGKNIGPPGVLNVGFLVTERNDFMNFHLRIKTMICEGRLCNLAFRVGENLDNTKKGLWPNAYLLNLGGTTVSPGQEKQTIGSIRDTIGSMRDHGEALDAGLVPGRWFEMDLIAKGSHFKVLIDGKQVLDCLDGTNAFPRGRILLQCRPNTVVKFERLEIKELAAADYDKAIELEPERASAWRDRGEYYANLKEWDKTIADYTKAIEIEPKNAQLWHQRAHAHERLQQWDRAFTDFSESIELSPKDPSYLYCRARCYHNLGQYEKAIADYSKGIELNPKEANPYNQLAWLLATAGKPEVRDSGRALDLANKAVELAPKEGNFWNTLGVAHYRGGDWKAALAALEKSMKLRQGGDGVDWFFLAMSHEKLGDDKSARQWYDRATRWTDKNRPNDEELRRFRAEAAQVLGVDKKKE